MEKISLMTYIMLKKKSYTVICQEKNFNFRDLGKKFLPKYITHPPSPTIVRWAAT